jgi:hypothetical protein
LEKASYWAEEYHKIVILQRKNGKNSFEKPGAS